MAANNSMLMHPAAAALNGAARLAHRGAQPKLMADAADTFLVFNAWMDKEQGFGPNGEVGILEEEVSSVLANAVRPGDGAVDAAGNSPGVFTHGLDAARWQQVWDQLLADGFDPSVPAATKGDALVAIRAFVDANGAGHAAYQPVAGDWYALQGPAGAGALHFARYFSWEECCDERGAARWASVLQSYTRGWATAVSRQGAGTFTVAPVLDGMWAEAQASGPAMRTGVVGVARARRRAGMAPGLGAPGWPLRVAGRAGWHFPPADGGRARAAVDPSRRGCHATPCLLYTSDAADE